MTGEWEEGYAISIADVTEEMFEDRFPWDQYFSPATYTEPIRRTETMSRTGVLYADLDDHYDHEMLCVLEPTLRWETSPDRLQAIWFLDQPVTRDLHIDLNRRLNTILDADHSSWIPTKLLRVPERTNYKRGQVISHIHYFDPEIVYPVQDLLDDLPQVKTRTISEGLPVPPTPTPREHRALLAEVWPLLDHGTRLMLTQQRVKDRSRHLTLLANRLRAVGIDPPKNFAVLSRLAVNKFSTRPEVLWRSVVLTAYSTF